jgi:hypothetical protein
MCRERFLERRIERRFETFNEVSAFCEDLTALGCEGLSDCVGFCSCCDFHDRNKIDKCYRAATLSQKYDPEDFRSVGAKISQEEYPDRYWCACDIKSEEKEEAVTWKTSLQRLKGRILYADESLPSSSSDESSEYLAADESPLPSSSSEDESSERNSPLY